MEHNWSKTDPGRPVVGIGELLWDVFPAGKQLGGAPANFACHVSQMGLNGVVISGVPQYEIKTDVAWDNIPFTAELAALAAPASPVSSALSVSEVFPDSSSLSQNSLAGGADLQRLGWWIKKQLSLKMVVLTCGLEGSYVFHDGGGSFQSSPKVEVVDTVGAGDSFTAAFVASLLRGCSVSDAHRRASEVAAYVCTRPGATPPLPPSLLSS